MSQKHNRRQRKKLRIGEFQEFGFEIYATFREAIDDKQIDTFLDAFVIECVELNGLAFGGWAHKRLSGYVTRAVHPRSAAETDRELVLNWLTGRNELDDLKVGELSDAWYGHNA
jgi:uncharacterized protein YggL (DUF469 family)